MSVTPKAFEGFMGTPLSIFGIGPKWTITCGKCEASFTKRVPFVDRPGIVCPYCGVTNIIPVIIK